jgi:hypothetical protein
MEEYQPELEGEPIDQGQDYEFGGDVEPIEVSVHTVCCYDYY